MKSRVKKVRKQKGLTQDELSELAGVRQAEISLIENDQKPQLTLVVAKRIAKALGCTVDYLWPD
jgi:transcriptional regulator with XRE-family HTH domain